MTFEYWLNKYMGKDKAACDLLLDYQHICAQEKCLGQKKPKLTLQHLEDHNACQAAINTFNRLYSLYANDVLSNKKGG